MITGLSCPPISSPTLEAVSRRRSSVESVCAIRAVGAVMAVLATLLGPVSVAWTPDACGPEIVIVLSWMFPAGR